jgi:catechol 2,3-dioxygenase-like lactoylglutathione lyase family enzyme
VLHSSDVIAFVATTDSERARGFYEAALGLPLLRDEPFAVVFDANAPSAEGSRARSGSLHDPRLEGARRARDRLLSGGTWNSLRALSGPRARRRWCLGVAERRPSAWFKDPDGNVLSLTQD